MAKQYINNHDFLLALRVRKEAIVKAKASDVLSPVICSYIGACIMKICDRLARSGKFRSYCVDDQTQALTKRGWLNHDEISLEDEILSMDVKTRTLVWSKTLSIYKDHYEGMMFHLTGATIDALVTPKHRFVTEEKGLTIVDDLLVKDHIVTLGKPLEVVEEIYSDDFVKLVGWVVTEGTIEEYERKRIDETSYYIRIIQSKKVNPDNCVEIAECIEKLTSEDPPNWRKSHTIKDSGVTSFWCPKNLSKKILDVAPNKVLGFDFIFSLSQRQRLILIDVMLRADGCGTQYFQVNKEHVDSFVALCAISGYNIHTDYREWQTKFGFCKGYLITLSRKDKCYLEKVNFYGGKRGRGGEWNGTKLHTPTVPYDGIVWCPTTEYGTFLCRRGSRIYVTGNSYIDEMQSDAIEKMVAGIDVFDANRIAPRSGKINPFAFFTQITWNAFLNRIDIEKKQQAIKFHNAVANIPEFLISGENSEATTHVLEEYERKQKTKKDKAKFKKAAVRVA